MDRLSLSRMALRHFGKDSGLPLMKWCGFSKSLENASVVGGLVVLLLLIADVVFVVMLRYDDCVVV